MLNLVIAIPLLLILLFRGWLWKQRKEGFPFDAILLILGVVAVRTGINIDLILVSISIGIPLWLPCAAYLFLNIRSHTDYFISTENIFGSALIGIIIGLAIGYFIDSISGYPHQSVGVSIWIYECLTAFGEELFFRSILLGLMKKVGIRSWVSILIQASIFLLGHLNYFHSQNWIALSGVLLVGLSCGWITLKYRNITGAIFLHAIYNLFFLIS